ncbi:MAG: hypothetical protein AAF514_09080 [Verrucomicrobiota bacterium]
MNELFGKAYEERRNRFPVERYRTLGDRRLVQLLVEDELERLNVAEYLFWEYGEDLMRVAIKVAPWEAYDELAACVRETIVTLLEYGKRPHPTFQAVADGDREAEIRLLPYAKEIVRNQLRSRMRKSYQEKRFADEVATASPDNIVYPKFEQRSRLAEVRERILSLKLGKAENEIARLYLERFPDRPEFSELCSAHPDRSEKAERRSEERFIEKLRAAL